MWFEGDKFRIVVSVGDDNDCGAFQWLYFSTGVFNLLLPRDPQNDGKKKENV